ncbi:tetratricopeptide repeat-containing sensor histidine kinase [Ferruginibacter profundus]
MKLFFLLLIIFPGNTTIAQKQGQAFIDSLINEIPKEKDDTLRAKIIYKIVLKYAESDPDKTIAFAKTGLDLSRKAGWKKGEGSFLISMGNAYSYKGDYAKAITLLDTALTISKAIKNYKGISVALNTTAGIFLQQGNHTKAVDYFFQALKIAEEIKDTLNTGDANFNIAAAYASQNDHTKALTYHEKALQAYEMAKRDDRIELAYTSIGLDYSNLKNYEAAKNYLAKASAINKQTGNNRQLAIIYGNYGSVYSNTKDYENALSFYLKANELWTTIAPGSQNAISIIGNIGGAYLDLAQHDSSVTAAHKTDPAFQKNNLLINAETWLKKAVLLYKQNGDIAYEAVYGQMLADVYSMKGDYKSAFENYKLYHTRDDSIHSQENKNAIAGIEGQREVAIRDKEIEINKLALSNTRKTQWALIGGLLLLSIIGGLLFLQSRTRKKNNTTLLQLNSELDEANKLKAKFFAILSHDFRGPVSRLVHFLHLQKEDAGLWSAEQAAAHEKKITESAESLLENMEAMLTWSKGQMENFQPTMRTVAVSDLFAYLNNFFINTDNVQLVFKDAGNLKVTTDENYLQTIMHNLTSNAIKALQHTPDATIVWNAKQEGGKTILSITDNGPGIADEQARVLQDDKTPVNIKGGLGFHLIRDLAKAIHCTIRLQQVQQQGTSFSLSI